MIPLDCLLVHTPKFGNYYKPMGHFTWLNYMAVGLLALADHLERNGVRTRILHQGVQWMNDRSWRLEDSIKAFDTPLVGVSLHWHHQAYDVIETCRRIRELLPQARIILGGFTASFYHDELVRDFDCIDGVIRGDGEAPLLTLAQAVRAGRDDFRDVPNLTWRNAQGDVVPNGLSYCATADELNRLRFSNMELLEDYRTYVDYVTFPFVVLTRVSKEFNFRKVTIGRKLFPVTVGRGCPLDCTWCAGSFHPQKERISGRGKVAWRSHDAVLNDIRRAMEYGYEAMYTVFDPMPQPEGQDYFIELFSRLRREGLGGRIGWMHEATGLTSRPFIDAFAETFPDDFRILGVSPESGSEEVRRLNKGYFYSNEQLYDMLEYATARNVQVQAYFSYGMPGENEHRLAETVAMRREIERRFGKRAVVQAMSIEIEPGSPWQLRPQEYGIITSRRSFADFYRAHDGAGENAFAGFGYYLPDFFETPLDVEDPEGDFARRLQELKCRHFCFLRPRLGKRTFSMLGRLACNALCLARSPNRKDRPASGGR